MIQLKTQYDEMRAFGLVGLRLNLLRGESLSAPVSFRVNGDNPRPTGFDIKYLNAKRQVDFALNTYKFNDGEIRIEFISESFTSQITLNVENHYPAGKFTAPYLQRYPALLPYPITAELWKEFGDVEFPVEPDFDFISQSDFYSFQTRGWLVFDDVLDMTLVDRARDQIERECLEGYGGYTEGSSQRIQQLHRKPGAIRDIYHDRTLRSRVSALFGTRMSPCQTLCYRYGSQQSFHSDFVHLTPFPVNLMCGVWIALEDVDASAGPLGIISGSHRMPRLTMKDFSLPPIKAGDYSVFDRTFNKVWSNYAQDKEVELALIKKGQVLVWDSNLLHCGTSRIDGEKTRHSVVLHFFADGGVCLYDALGVVGNPG